MKRLIACFFLILFSFAGLIAGTGSAATQTAGRTGTGSKHSGYISAVQSDLFVSAKPLQSVFSAKTEPGPGIRTNPDAVVSRLHLGFRLQQAGGFYNALTRYERQRRHAGLIYPFHGFW